MTLMVKDLEVCKDENLCKLLCEKIKEEHADKPIKELKRTLRKVLHNVIEDCFLASSYIYSEENKYDDTCLQMKDLKDLVEFEEQRQPWDGMYWDND